LNAKKPSIGGSSKRKKILFLTGSLLLFVLGITAIGGGAAVLYYNSGTDAEGYAISPVFEVRSSANAFVLWVAPLQSTGSFGRLGDENIGAAKWVVKAAYGGKQIFAGWTDASEGATYVDQFRYETPDQGWHWWVEAYYAEIGVPSTKIVHQGAPTRAPAAESFWLESVVTNDSATIHWDPTWEQNAGMKMIILMNADGSSGVNADLQLGFKVPILTWLPYLLIPFGIILCLGGYLLFRRRKRA
jgi:hypothetical protein